MIRRHIGQTAGLVAALILAIACSGEGGPDRGRGAPGGGGSRRMAFTAVQLGAFADSTNAIALRDSLDRAGWVAYLAPVQRADRTMWRVLVQPASNSAVPRLVQETLESQGREAIVVRDTAPAPRAAMAELFAVNRGDEGAMRRVRWVMSPDRRSMIVMEDPVGVENEPVPNGFVFASETGPFFLQVDSVWDVAPSPSWERIAYGRARVVMTEPRHSEIRPEQWQELAEDMGLAVDSLRRAVFASSSMNVVFATAQPVVVDVTDVAMTTPGSVQSAERELQMAGGWRVGWASEGSVLALGTRPRRAVDDGDAQRWIAVDTTRWEPTGLLPTGREPWTPKWTEGPLIDISVPFDMRAPRSVPIEGGRVASRDGWIRISRDSTDEVAGGRIVAPGAVLAATRDARFIAAIVPRQVPDRFIVPLRVVVYQVIE